MNMPRINNDERGLTVNKPLAWAMLTFLVLQGGGDSIEILSKQAWATSGGVY
jgi:hypothetical protein